MEERSSQLYQGLVFAEAASTQKSRLNTRDGTQILPLRNPALSMDILNVILKLSCLQCSY